MTLQEKLVSSYKQTKGQETAYIQNLRNEGFHTFETKGFPTLKEEDWRYTNLKPVLNKEYGFSENNPVSIEKNIVDQFLLNGLDSYKLIFIDEVFNADLSEISDKEYKVLALSSVLNNSEYKETIEKHYAKIAPKELAMVALNNAFAQEGAFIYVPKKTVVSKPIEILFLSTKENKILQTRNLVVVDSSSEVTIIESHQNTSTYKNLTNAVTEMYVDANARIDYTKIQNDTEDSSLIDNTYTKQEADTVCLVNTFTFGGQLVRNNLEFVQEGSNSDSILNSVTIIGGTQLVDHHTLVEHKATHCESNETYKGIYLDKSKGVFNGKVYVHKEAQKLNAYQQNNSILLSDHSEINSKPQLEIFADDVRCTHGCTIGQLDADAVFYLQSRGIPKKEAKALLTYAFASEGLAGIKVEALKDKINKLIANKLEVSVDFNL